MVKLRNPKKDLRSFGFLMALIVGGVLGALIPWWRHGTFNTWLVGIGGAFAAFASLSPLSLGPIFQAWMRIGAVLGWVNTRIILAAVFYLLFFPTSLCRRLLGKDSLLRKLDDKTASYRNIPEYDTDVISNMERPF